MPIIYDKTSQRRRVTAITGTPESNSLTGKNGDETTDLNTGIAYIYEAGSWQIKSAYRAEIITIPLSTANNTTIETNISIDGLKFRIVKDSNSFYRPLLLNNTGISLRLTFASVIYGASLEIRNTVNATIAAGATQNLDNNDISWWNTANTEQLTATLIVNDVNIYEFKIIGWTVGTNTFISLSIEKKL
jgi:hypothetical protein